MREIVTDRLKIRRFQEADVEPYIKIMTNPAVTKYLGDGKDLTETDVIKNLARFKKVWDEHGFGVFAVIESTSKDIIGHCGFLPMKDGRELLYAFDSLAWGKGYATEACRAILEDAKNQFEWTEIYAIAYPQNKPSIAVLNKLGFLNIRSEEYFGHVLEEFLLKI